MYIFLLVFGGGQDKLRLDSLPPGGEDNQGGGQDIPRQLASCPGGKINWDTGTL